MAVETVPDGDFALFCKLWIPCRNSLHARSGQDWKLLRMSSALILRALIDQHRIKLRLTTLIRKLSICFDCVSKHKYVSWMDTKCGKVDFICQMFLSRLNGQTDVKTSGRDK
jgi:hypothetical protein